MPVTLNVMVWHHTRQPRPCDRYSINKCCVRFSKCLAAIKPSQTHPSLIMKKIRHRLTSVHCPRVCTIVRLVVRIETSGGSEIEEVSKRSWVSRWSDMSVHAWRFFGLSLGVNFAWYVSICFVKVRGAHIQALCLCSPLNSNRYGHNTYYNKAPSANPLVMGRHIPYRR